MSYKTNKMTSTTTKMILIVGIMMTLIIPPSGMRIANAIDQAVSTDTLTSMPEIPFAPTTTGCYHYNGKVWANIPCLTSEEMKEFKKPTVGNSFGVHGLRDSSSAIQSYGLTDVQFSTYNGETDSQYGTAQNIWSIQLNPNQWHKTGSTDWYTVQFTEQNRNTPTGKGVCVWQINVSTQSYTSNCSPVPLQTLSSSYHGSVEGKTFSNGNIQSQYCNIGTTTQCWAVVTTDLNQARTHWLSSSGTILGYGGGSQANFVSPTSLVTNVKTGPASSATTLWDYGTQETANLNYGTSSTSCAFSLCTRTSTLTN